VGLLTITMGMIGRYGINFSCLLCRKSIRHIFLDHEVCCNSDVGEISISLRRNRFRYSCNFHCIKYNSLINKDEFKKIHVVVRKREKRVYTFFNGFIGMTT